MKKIICFALFTSILGISACTKPLNHQTQLQIPHHDSHGMLLPAWYSQHKQIIHFRKVAEKTGQGYGIQPLFSGRLPAHYSQQIHIPSQVTQHAIGAVMYSTSADAQGRVGFVQEGSNAPCTSETAINKQQHLLGGYALCTPQAGSVQIRLFNHSNAAVDYVMYDAQEHQRKY